MKRRINKKRKMENGDKKTQKKTKVRPKSLNIMKIKQIKTNKKIKQKSSQN